MTFHVAFLRGVGGPRPAPGEALKACLGGAGYDPVKPVLATGNVVLGLGRKRRPPEEPALSDLLARHFGYPLPAILRSGDEVLGMIDGEPFRGVDEERLTRFVAMLAADAPDASAFPEPAPDAGYRLVGRRDRELLFLIDRSLVKTPDVMVRIDRAFRKRVTTRNWNTMEKVAAAIRAG